MGVVHHLMGLRKLRNLKVAATKSLNLGLNFLIEACPKDRKHIGGGEAPV